MGLIAWCRDAVADVSKILIINLTIIFADKNMIIDGAEHTANTHTSTAFNQLNIHLIQYTHSLSLSLPFALYLLAQAH